jgi:hypothetical protein
MTFCDVGICHIGSDESGSACHENIHERLLFQMSTTTSPPAGIFEVIRKYFQLPNKFFIELNIQDF